MTRGGPQRSHDLVLLNDRLAFEGLQAELDRVPGDVVTSPDNGFIKNNAILCESNSPKSSVFEVV